MIGVIDYGMGNLFSVTKALEHLGADVVLVDTPEKMRKAEKLILPGVGAFGDAMGELTRRKLIDPIKDAVAKNVPLMGVCLGLQLLFQTSEEGGAYEGLGLLKGKVKKFPSPAVRGEGERLKVPHMGWNQVAFARRDSVLWNGVPDQSFFYFVHSYFAVPDNADTALGITDYGFPFASVVGRERLYACQFHPEKSHDAGRRVLRNFLERA